MMRSKKIFELQNVEKFKNQALEWSKQFSEVVWLDGNLYPERFSDYDAVLAVEAFTAIKTDEEEGFAKLEEYQEATADWIFGYLSYELKNDTEALESNNCDGLEFPALYFFQPSKLFLIKGNIIELCYLRMMDDQMDDDMKEIHSISASGASHRKSSNKASPEILKLNARVSKPLYLERVQKMLDHIQRGDIYEANYCQEFFAAPVSIRPLEIYKALNTASRTPFATYLKLEEYHLMSASPERYLKKKGSQLISQPIKGTSARAMDPDKDFNSKERLKADPKERAENLMIVDLVRNDLSRTAVKGSVEVEELCGVYTFEQVHQMISTVVCRLREEVGSVEALRQTFPMGSMTGAPKIAAMRIIEELEESKRGLYSGAVGYFNPAGDFDFNVVIRSILYNKKNRYVSFSVGSAITAASVAEKEYEECLVKARAMRKVLEEELTGDPEKILSN